MNEEFPRTRFGHAAGIGRRAVVSAALVAAGLIATAPVAFAATTTVHTDVLTVYQGGTANIALTGPSNDLCAIFINGNLAEWGSLGGWGGHLDWGMVASASGNAGSADNTVDFRCYDQTTNPDVLVTDEASASPSAAPSEPAGPVAYTDAYDSGVTIVYKAGEVTPPPTGTDSSRSGSGGSALPLVLASMLAGLALIALRRTAIAGR